MTRLPVMLLWALAAVLPAAVLVAGGDVWQALLAGAVPAALAIGFTAGLRSAGSVERSLIDALEHGVTIIGRDRRLAYANPRARTLLGIPDGPLERVAYADFAWTVLGPDGEALPEEERPAWHTAHTGESLRVELPIRLADGTTHWLATSIQALPESPRDSGPFAVVVAFADVTERRAAVDELERSNEELAQFAYVASHDLSEPLRMVTSYLQLLRRRYGGRLDDDADEFIEYAVEGANRMRTLIEDLLAYSRAGRGADPVPVDCGVVVADVLSTLAAAVADARAAVHVDLLPTVSGDRGAAHAAVPEPRRQRAEVPPRPRAPACGSPRRRRRPSGFWAFTVADDGIGIDARHADRVFKMFQRLHGRDAYEGTGIGLAICRKIVERHGGRIWLEPRDGGGTVFRLHAARRAGRRRGGARGHGAPARRRARLSYAPAHGRRRDAPPVRLDGGGHDPQVAEVRRGRGQARRRAGRDRDRQGQHDLRGRPGRRAQDRRPGGRHAAGRRDDREPRRGRRAGPVPGG